MRALQPLLAVELLVANDGWVAGPVKAVSRRRWGPQASLYRTPHPAILGHRGRRLATAQPGVSKPGRSTQNLRIRHFYGTSENAVKTQIWTAVCVYELAAIVKKELALDVALYTFLQILSVHSFDSR